MTFAAPPVDFERRVGLRRDLLRFGELRANAALAAPTSAGCPDRAGGEPEPSADAAEAALRLVRAGLVHVALEALRRPRLTS